MKKIIIPVLVLLGCIACKKDKGFISPNSLLGSWRYTGSTIDSGNNRITKLYDPSIGSVLGDTLRFAAPDTVYYTYQSSTTWSNFRTWANNLILIGGMAKDTVPVYSISATSLQLGFPVANAKYTAVFEKFNP